MLPMIWHAYYIINEFPGATCFNHSLPNMVGMNFLRKRRQSVAKGIPNMNVLIALGCSCVFQLQFIRNADWRYGALHVPETCRRYFTLVFFRRNWLKIKLFKQRRPL